MPSGVFFSWVHSFSITVNISARYWGAHRKFCEISKNTFFTEHLWTSASEHGYSTGVARIPPISKMESFARILNGFAIAAKLSTLDFFRLLAPPLEEHEQSMSKASAWTKCNRKKLQHAKSAYRRLMSNENIATCRGATRNSAVHKKSATQKKCNMKWLLHKKYNMEMVQYEKSATWKKCNIKRVQHEISAT